MWTFLKQQQQRGAQLHARPGAKDEARRAGGEAPAEAVAGREVQDHDYADLDVSGSTEPMRGIDYPATNPPAREGDITPTAPDAEDKRVDWDEVVQPERQQREGGQQRQGDTPRGAPDDLPLPEGK